MADRRDNQTTDTFLSDEQAAVLAAAGDRDAEQLILTRFKGLVLGKADRFFMAGAERDDVLQEGMIGLVSAIRSYDPQKEVPFSVFAAICVERQIVSAVRASNRKKNIPLNSYISFDSPADANDPDGDAVFLELYQNGSSSSTDPSVIVTDRESMASMQDFLEDSLSVFERRVLEVYLEQDLSYQEIGDRLGVTAKAVDNALQRIKNKLKTRR